MTLMLVLIFFGLFMALLFEIFPSGLSLSQIVEQRKGLDKGDIKRDSTRSSIVDVAGDHSERAAATLTSSENDVKSKNAGSLAWGPVQKGMALFDRDAVQTSHKSSAQISFDNRNYLTIGGNSLVIIKRIEKDTNLNQRRTAMVMLEGELQGQTAASGQGPLNLEITTPSAVSKISPAASGIPGTDFRISVNPDKSSSIVVYKGQAEVSAQGRTVKIPEGNGVTVRQGQAPGAVVRLPSAPSLTAPGHQSTVHYREAAPRVRLAWNGAAGETFHLQLARDAAMKEMVIDKKFAAPEFFHGNLKKGSYFWRVSRVDDGREGRASEVRRFDVLQNLVPPALQVTFPAGQVREEQITVSGVAAPGAMVYVGGKAAAIDASGTFSHTLPIRSGMNLVTVEAVDPAGNVTYRSQYVQGRF